MESKYILAAAYLSIAAFGGVVAACLSKRIRDVFFFLLVTMSAVTEQWDVNFVSREWYRGTTCGFEISLVDVFALSLLVSAVLLPREGEKRFYLPGSLGLMILFFLFSILCVAMADPKLFGMFALLKLVRGLIVFLAVALYVRGERELKILLIALATIVCYEALRAVEQRYRFGIHRVFSDFNAPNSLSMYMCTTAPVFVAAITSNIPRWLKAFCAAAIALAGLSVLLTISRAGVVTLGFVLLLAVLFTITWKFTAKKVFVTVFVTIAVVGALAKSWESLASRFGEASLEEEYENTRVQSRGYYVKIAAAIAEDHWLGVGPNNWSYWVSNRYGPRMGFKFAPYPGPDRPPKFEVEDGANVDDPQAAPAHSLAALTAGEMGVVGLVLMFLLWFRWFQMGASFLWKRTDELTHRINVGILFGILGNFLQSLTEWVFYQTALYFTFHILIGALASMYYLKRQARKAEKARQRMEDEEELESEVLEPDVEYARRSPA